MRFLFVYLFFCRFWFSSCHAGWCGTDPGGGAFPTALWKDLLDWWDHRWVGAWTARPPCPHFGGPDAGLPQVVSVYENSYSINNLVNGLLQFMSFAFLSSAWELMPRHQWTYSPISFVSQWLKWNAGIGLLSRNVYSKRPRQQKFLECRDRITSYLWNRCL